MTFDNATSYNGGTGSFNHTTGSGAGRFMFVLTEGAVTAVSYNSVSLTLNTNYSWPYGNLKVWILASPSSGTNSVSITSSSSTNVVVATYSGFASIQPEASTNTQKSFNDITINNSVTTLTNNAWVLGFCVYLHSSNNQNAGSGATKRISIAGNVSGGSSLGIYDSNGSVTPPSSYSMTIDASSGSGPWALVMYSVTAPKGSASPLLLLL